MGPSCDPDLAAKFPDECICEPIQCEIDDDCDGDHNDCTEGLCSNTSRCSQPAVMDGTACAGGTCQAGVCSLTTTVLPCDEQGIRNAVAAGGDEPYTFDCSGPTTVVARAGIRVHRDVILDGGGEITIHGHFGVAEDAVLDLRGFGVTKAPEDAIHGGTLKVANCDVSGNAGGGIVGETLTVSNSTVSDNIGPGLSGRTLTVTESTVSGNTGGGIGADGGMLSLTQSTVSENSRNSGGGIWANEALVTVANSTVSGNSVEFNGSAIFMNRSTLTVTNSLINGDCSGDITSNGYNIESPGDTCGFDQSTDLVNVSADALNLGPLADNGGPTMTHALGAGSVAIDVIPDAECVDADGEPLTTDQRGEPRPEMAGSMCDVGSFELQQSEVLPSGGGGRCSASRQEDAQVVWFLGVLMLVGIRRASRWRRMSAGR